MSIKENIDYIKDEINTEEKFLEGFVKFERFWKKYKISIIGVVAVILISVVGIMTKDYMDNVTKQKANEAFNMILKNPSDSNALSILKDTNLDLHNIALFLKAKKEGKSIEINLPLLKELSQYSIAMKNSDIEKLNSVTLKSDFVLKEYALFNKALLQAKEGDFIASKETLKLLKLLNY